MANRHGLIAGATGTGKTVTLKTMAESFSAAGVPVFLADVKGDISGIEKSCPVTLFDLYGENGIQLRTTVSEMGPLLLSRIMELNDLQSDILTIVFKIADDERLLLRDTKDLKAMLNHVSECNKDYEADYGKMAPQSIATIIRALVALESAGAETFFGDPAIDINDFFRLEDGKGMVNILDSSSLINNGKLYSMFILYLISELFETLPEVGDLDKPKMVFFFDEAHLLFDDAPKALVSKIEQVVKLIRSKGVGIYFVTQNPKDIPDGVLSQLQNKIEHALHAYSPAEQKAVRAAADSFPVNPNLDTYETIMALGTGEAVVSFLKEDGTPTPAEKIKVYAPEAGFDSIDPARKDQLIKGSVLYQKYAESTDIDSAYEFFIRKGLEEDEAREEAARAAEEEKQRIAEEKQAEKDRIAAEKAEAKAAEQAAKQAEKEKLAAEKADLKEKEKADNAKKKAAKSVGNTVAGTVGREVGKTVGANFGKFGKTLGGNVGASLGRGLLSTLFKS